MRRLDPCQRHVLASAIVPLLDLMWVDEWRHRQVPPLTPISDSESEQSFLGAAAAATPTAHVAAMVKATVAAMVTATAAASAAVTSTATAASTATVITNNKVQPHPKQGGKRITEAYFQEMTEAECIWRFR